MRSQSHRHRNVVVLRRKDLLSGKLGKNTDIVVDPSIEADVVVNDEFAIRLLKNMETGPSLEGNSCQYPFLLTTFVGTFARSESEESKKCNRVCHASSMDEIAALIEALCGHDKHCLAARCTRRHILQCSDSDLVLKALSHVPSLSPSDRRSLSSQYGSLLDMATSPIHEMDLFFDASNLNS